uniref:Uncharacterized protein n=1 Tax=Globisporangium ultimum (strain ATCC 200006 / CBS 805.95 / DAOM BR144) TaxID=431595 RepID=K3W5D7_GLOUD
MCVSYFVTGAGAYISIQGSGIDLNYVYGYYAVLGDYLLNQIISFFDWISMQTQPPEVIVLNQRTKIDLNLQRIKLLLPRGAIGNPIARHRKPERMEIDVRQVLIHSRPYPTCARMEQLRIQIKDIHISTCIVDTGIRPHTDAVGSVDEAVVQADKKSAHLKLEQQIAASKTKMFSHKAVFIDVVALPIPIDAKKKKKESKQHKKAGFKDMEDAARGMEKLCSHVMVSLCQPGDWDNENEDDKSSAQASENRKAAAVKANKAIELALDLHQLELFGCILTENFGYNELVPRATSGATLEDEFLATNIQVLVGDVSLSVVRSNNIVDYEEKKALNPEERALAQVDLSSVKVIILGYSSERAQYRVLSSKASLWKVDVESVHAEDNGENSSTAAPVAKKVLTSCAELYRSTGESGSPGECIDVTIDEHKPSSDPNTVELPMDIRVHIDTCAFTPAIIQFASRVAPFLFCKPRFRDYSPQPDGPMNVSVTTGAVYSSHNAQ